MSDQPIGRAPYPVDGVLLAALAPQARGVAHPAAVAQEALRCWNRWLTQNDEQQRALFLEHAIWLVEHATPCAGDGAGWPVLTRLKTLPDPISLLSASTQGLALSVLVRAYQVTSDERYRALVSQAARPFARDIFDGGVGAPFGSAGLFFQEQAAYPAAHDLGACLVALYGLAEYLALTNDAELAEVVKRCRSTLSTTLPVFDTGFWSRADLASRRLAAPATHALHIALLKALASAWGDAGWSAVAERWAGYQRSFAARLRYQLSSIASRWRRGFWGWVRRRFFRGTLVAGQQHKKNVCVPITAFPVPGGMRSVLAGIASAMEPEWQMEYLTRQVGPNPDGLTIWRFGNKLTSNWHFPLVWLYVAAGWRRLVALLREGRCALVLPQDGTFTGAYAALAARVAGVRVVCVEHGTIPQLYNQTYRADRLRALRAAPWYRQALLRPLLVCYWPSLRLLARVATRWTDAFLVHGDDIEQAYRQRLGVSPDRMIRYAFLIDTQRYPAYNAQAKAQQRAHMGLPADSVVVAMVNRLAPEKGLDVALPGISGALQQLPANLAARVRVVIAGDGPLRAQVEADIRRFHLEETCVLLGTQPPAEVARLLSISDLFLFTAIRDSNSVAVLEAMAAGLPVIASAVPPSKAVLLGEGRGMAIAPGDAEAVAVALAEAVRDPQRCQEMGRRARAYIETQHGAEAIRRSIFRATGWPLEANAVLPVASSTHLIAAEQGRA
jgi:glycosyltransferase involved in cell wall biosynthesis